MPQLLRFTAVPLMVILAQLTVCFPAIAQERLVLEEVIVTAQKREESVQDIPMTVNALQGDTLNELKMFTFEELQQVTPGLEMRSIDGRAGSIALRGVDYNPNSAASQAVDLYWNGTTLGSNASGGVFQQLFDIARVEVLRGPQGTLQGRTSPAGAISIYTRLPDTNGEFNGFVQATITDNDGTNTQVASNIPIVEDTLAARVAFVYDNSDLDKIENLIGGDVSETETKAGRFSLRWLPTDSISADLVWQYLENEIDTTIPLEGSSTLDQDLPELGAFDRRGINPQVDDFDGEYNYVSLNLDWDLATHRLTYVLGFSDLESTRSFDGASGNSEVGFDPVEETADFPQVGVRNSQLNNPQYFDDTNETWSHELRLASVDHESVNYILGAYYSEESGDFVRAGIRDLPAGLGTSVYFETSAPTPFDLENYGFFGNLNIAFTEQWTVQLGARWQEFKRDLETVAVLDEDVFFPTGTVLNEGDVLLELVTGDEGVVDEDKVTGSASLQYDFDHIDAVGYLSVATGWRPGGVNVAAQDLFNFSQFSEEDSIAYEAGLKTKLLEGRLRLDTALFYQEFDDYIGRFPRIPVNRDGIPRADGSPSGAASLTANGDATVTGIELEAEYLLTENWRAGGGVSYVEAEYDGAMLPCEDGDIPNGQLLNTCDFDGITLGSQPPFSVRLTSEYTIPFDAFETYALGLYQYNDERDDVDADGGKLGSYWLFDLHLGLRSRGSADWEVSLFARNLFDEEALADVQPEFRDFEGGSTGYKRVVLVPERRFGLSATYRF